MLPDCLFLSLSLSCSCFLHYEERGRGDESERVEMGRDLKQAVWLLHFELTGGAKGMEGMTAHLIWVVEIT